MSNPDVAPILINILGMTGRRGGRGTLSCTWPAKNKKKTRKKRKNKKKKNEAPVLNSNTIFGSDAATSGFEMCFASGPRHLGCRVPTVPTNTHVSNPDYVMKKLFKPHSMYAAMYAAMYDAAVPGGASCNGASAALSDQDPSCCYILMERTTSKTGRVGHRYGTGRVRDRDQVGDQAEQSLKPQAMNKMVVI